MVLIMMLSGIYIKAFCSEAADKRENFPSVADDLVYLAEDIFNHNTMQVGSFSAHLVSYASVPRQVSMPSMARCVPPLSTRLFSNFSLCVRSLSSMG